MKKTTSLKQDSVNQQILIAENAFKSGNIDLAESMVRQVLASIPGNSKANALLAYIAGTRGNEDLAFELLKKATSMHNASFDAFYYVGTIYLKRNLFSQAITSFKQSIRIGGEFFEALHDLGVSLAGAGLYEQAWAMFTKALALNPKSSELFYNMGRTLEALKRFDEALSSYDKALYLHPGFAPAWYNRGVILSLLKRERDAAVAYNQAIKHDPKHAKAWANLGATLIDLKHYLEALNALNKAIQLQPGIDYAFGNWLHTKMMLCSWDGLDEAFISIIDKVSAGDKACLPFNLLAMPAPPSIQKQCSEIHVKDRFQEKVPHDFKINDNHQTRIKIGYFSADFHNHATSYLMAELFERHDRSRFEIIGFSFGPDKQDEMRRRVQSGFDKFLDVRNMNDAEIAELARSEHIHIAVDLKGFTQDSRPGIFSHRAAPIQVNYLGYPGTMGATYMDYLIADKTVIPPEHLPYYTEKIAFLPDSYQVNDSSRKISAKTYHRAEVGLPETGFVFACFNNNFKITPDVFDIWMRLLLTIPDAVFWLFEGSESVKANLRQEAQKRGVAASRLIFADNLPLENHLARIQLADLFLDTFYYNAHTTTSDALWAGLPVLTCAGEAFAGRVAASLLHAAGVPELVTQTHKEYENLAIDLATHPQKLAAIKTKLKQTRSTMPLFDTGLFTKNIEAIYAKMWAQYLSGVPAAHFEV